LKKKPIKHGKTVSAAVTKKGEGVKASAVAGINRKGHRTTETGSPKKFRGRCQKCGTSKKNQRESYWGPEAPKERGKIKNQPP